MPRRVRVYEIGRGFRLQAASIPTATKRHLKLLVVAAGLTEDRARLLMRRARSHWRTAALLPQPDDVRYRAKSRRGLAPGQQASARAMAVFTARHAFTKRNIRLVKSLATLQATHPQGRYRAWWTRGTKCKPPSVAFYGASPGAIGAALALELGHGQIWAAVRSVSPHPGARLTAARSPRASGPSRLPLP
jgi:hypothetical protein